MMKNVTLKWVLFSSLCLLYFIPASAQGDMLTREEKLIGSTSDFLVGLHSGIFDCNQDYNYPFNLGVVGQYNYTPNVLKMWYLGAELGAFYTQNGEDGNLRTMGAMVSHFSIYPGVSFELNKKEYPEDESFREKIKSRKLKFAAGFTVGVPLKTYSSGIHYDPSNAKTGIGFTAMSVFEINHKLNVFGSFTRVNADMDGFGFDPETGDRTPGNKHDVSYWVKLGLAYNLLGR